MKKNHLNYNRIKSIIGWESHHGITIMNEIEIKIKSWDKVIDKILYQREPLGENPIVESSIDSFCNF